MTMFAFNLENYFHIVRNINFIIITLNAIFVRKSHSNQY